MGKIRKPLLKHYINIWICPKCKKRVNGLYKLKDKKECLECLWGNTSYKQLSQEDIKELLWKVGEEND